MPTNMRIPGQALLLASVLISIAGVARAQEDFPAAGGEVVQVTATRLPEDLDSVPAAITLVTGEELAARGVTTLSEALSLVAGVSAAAGGDGGPAGSVPELWGLKEFDAFLLVVDGVPWGGAFNPALTSLDLTGVERIEVMRGSAPVMYGATSFVGVIHVIHYAAGAGEKSYTLGGGSYSSGLASVSTPLPSAGVWRQSLSASIESTGFKDDRTGYERGQLLYRGALETGANKWRFDLAFNGLEQDPASPHPRQGRVLSPLVPLDANHNPKDAKIDENRLHLVAGHNRTLGSGDWTTNLSFTHSERDTVRGFLTNLSNTRGNARGYEQDLSVDDLFFESYWGAQLRPNVRVVAGIDQLFGKGEAESESFTYTVRLDGKGAPSSSSGSPLEEVEFEDERSFSGAFAQVEWQPVPRLSLELGLRINRTEEKKEGEAEPVGEEEEPGEEEGGEGKQTTTRGTGFVGVSFLAWSREHHGVWLFADYRNTYKPSAIDFGPEAEVDLLKPETAKSYEAGLKGDHFAGRVRWQLSAFQMDFTNLVLSDLVNGLPTLINAGSERFKGTELEVNALLSGDLRLQVGLAQHSAKFRRFTQEFDGVPTVLDGKRLEMSPEEMASAGLIYAPSSGFTGSVEVSYTGDRFLNKRNTALAPSYTTYAASLGYRFPKGELRLVGQNLSDERDPIAESELGDAQYYRLPARAVRLVWSGRW